MPFRGIPHNPLIVALDVPAAESAVRLAGELASLAGALKIGSELFTGAGPDIVRRIRKTGAAVFLDLKFHDIPNTVARAVAAATRLDVQMLTVHASGGPSMLRAAVAAARSAAADLGRPAPLVLAVTVLTSMDSAELSAVTLESEPARHVERLARLAVEAGVGGLVCSPLELPVLRRLVPREVKLVTPGIRTGPAAPGDDQRRTLGPAEAVRAGADWLVVGRPVYAAPDPGAAARAILDACAPAGASGGNA